LVRVKILFFSIFATALASSSIINPDFACKWKWLWKYNQKAFNGSLNNTLKF
jgi:hypothetical protein